MYVRLKPERSGRFCRLTWRVKLPGILIIGYGNASRGDDAVGLHAARQLERQFRDDPEIEIISSHQLTPEMADDISRSELVIFLDASCDGAPGTVRCKPIVEEGLPGGFTHHLSPAALISAAEQLYGEAPTAMSITLTGWSFELGGKLSSAAQGQLPELLRRTREVIASHRTAHATLGSTSRVG